MEDLAVVLLSIKIPDFHGKALDDSAGCLEDFLQKTEDLQERPTIQIFAEKMKGNAYFWHKGLADRTKARWERMLEAFRQKYVVGPQTFHTKKELNDRRMAAGETVDEYILAVRKMCRTLGRGQAECISRIILDVTR